MSHNTGVLAQPRACWLCPLLYPLCSARLPGHWAWHIGTAALSVPSFIRAITESKPAETWLSRDRTPLGLTGPRSDQASRRGSSSFLTSTCYDLWTDSKKAPDLIRAGSPPLKAAFGSASVAWNGKSGVRLHAGRRKLRQRHCGGGGDGGGDALIVMLQVQMALCFMCGLNGLCQPSYWRHIIWRDHTKTLSTKIQRFINKGHFHDSKCLLDGRGSGSRHERDKSLAGNWPPSLPPTKAEFLHF